MPVSQLVLLAEFNNPATNTSPTVALNSPPATVDSFSQPQLLFTGTDAEAHAIEYNVQVDIANTFNANNQIDVYSESNRNTSYGMGADSYFGLAQSFQCATSGKLSAVKFTLKKTGSPTGNAVAKLYAHSGTFGTSSVPTGAALATSDSFDVATLTTSSVLTQLNFSGAQQYAMVAGVNYVTTIEYSGGGAGVDYVDGGVDNTAPTHAGNLATTTNGTTWAASSGVDLCFYVYISPLINAFSVSDAGFSAGHPFASAAQVGYTLQSVLAAGTYYWRVAGIDPTGRNVYGAWSSTRSLVVRPRLWKSLNALQAMNRAVGW